MIFNYEPVLTQVCHYQDMERIPRLGGAAALYPVVGNPRTDWVRFPFSPLLLAAHEHNLNAHGHLRFWATPGSSRL